MKNEEEYEDDEEYEEEDTGFWVRDWTYCKTDARSNIWGVVQATPFLFFKKFAEISTL